MLAASTASAPPMRMPSTRCSSAPTPPEAITGTGTASQTARVSSRSKPMRVPSRSMLVSRISPAPCSAIRRAQPTASMPALRRPPWVWTSQPAPRAARSAPARRLASIATTMHCAPYLSDASRITCGLAAADGQRDEHLRRDRLDDVQDQVAVIAGRGDVEEGQLVGTLVVVARRDLDRIARVAQLDEIDALDDPAAGDVQARDDAFGEHRQLKRRVRRRAVARRRSLARCAQGFGAAVNRYRAGNQSGGRLLRERSDGRLDGPAHAPRLRHER